jgi:hypothetical protein
MNRNFLAAVAAGALLVGATAANAATQVYDFSVYNAAFVGNLGTVSVTDHGTDTLDIDVLLAANTFFQLQGNGGLKDAFWFDLPGLAGNTSVTYNISAPNADGVSPGGDYPTGGLFTGANYSNDAYGQGNVSGYDYAMRVRDTSAGSNLDYYTGHLTFSVTSTGGAPLSIASLGTGQSETFNSGTYNVVFGADLRQCLSPTCVTGPVGAIIQGGAVPEPATWAMLIFGFGGVGATLRRRRSQLAYA